VRMAERIKKGDHGDFLHQDISSHLWKRSKHWSIITILHDRPHLGWKQINDSP
jgi:hypothetical protein